MNVQPVGQNNNKVNFGINVKNRKVWNKALLETVEKSGLVEAIDRKYPRASVEYMKTDLSGLDMANDEPNFLTSLVFSLADKKVSTLHMNSHTAEGADRAMGSYVSGLSIDTLEKMAADGVQGMQYSVSITPVKKQNPVKRFFLGLIGMSDK